MNVATERKLRWRVEDHGSHVICSCGTWNTISIGYNTSPNNRCHSCRRGFFQDMSATDVSSIVIMSNPKDSEVLCVGWSLPHKNNPKMADGCGAMLCIGDLEYIQTHWYTEPYSCTGGDYWNAGEGQFVCPKCLKLNRLYERPDVVDMKQFFGSVRDTYER